MSNFKREERYIVIKRRDISDRVEGLIRREIENHDVPTIECVVVECDWPNYEHVWSTVQQVAEGTWFESEESLSEQLAQRQAEEIDQLRELAYRVRDRLSHSEVDCLGDGFTANGELFPIRDEVIDDITRVLNNTQEIK